MPNTDYQTALRDATALLRRSERERWSPERTWAESVTRQRRAEMLSSEAALAAYLVDEAAFWLGKALDAEAVVRITAEARRMWAERQSARVVPADGMDCIVDGAA